MQTLRPAENAGQRLYRNSHDVIKRLLYRERDAGRLGVESQLERPFVCRTKTIAHCPGPNAPRCPILRNLFKEIVMGIKKERNAGHEFIDGQSSLNAPIDVFQAIAKREGKFLYRCRPG